MKTELADFDGDWFRTNRFLELARRNTDFPELTGPILHAFAEKVLVHEADKANYNKPRWAYGIAMSKLSDYRNKAGTKFSRRCGSRFKRRYKGLTSY
jgi:hypothetical protein